MRTLPADTSHGAPNRLAPGLYVVATPIGNLDDLTFRARDTLAACDAILCEDTRITRRLLERYDIRTTMRAYHEHNAARTRPEILAQLNAGAALALVTDAGAPVVADPGFRLVREARRIGVRVTALPGPSALSTALMLAPVASDKHLFLGFPPPRSAARKKWFARFAAVPSALIFFESPRRLGACLADAAGALGDRDASVLRELTKKFEEVVDGTLEILATRYQSAEPRGEIVVVVGAPPEDDTPDEATVDAALEAALRAGASTKAAAVQIAERLQADKRAAYDAAVRISKRMRSGES